jgi:recombination protein RecT
MTKQDQPANNPQAVAKKKAPIDLMKLDAKGLAVQAEPVFMAMGLPREQFIREAGYAMQMMTKTPYLLECDRGSLITAIGNVALAGLTLSPDKKLGYLIPRKGRVYFETSYMGKKEILIQSGSVRDVWANLVHENDEFIPVEGSERKLIHNLPRNPFDAKARGKVIGGYWCAVLPNGERPFGLISIDRINEIMARSESVKAKKGPTAWDTDFEEMAKKTLINNAYKYLPKTNISDSVMAILDIEAENDNEDYAELRKAQAVETAKQKDHFDDDGPANREIYSEYAEVVPEPAKKKTPVTDVKEMTAEEIEADMLAMERGDVAEQMKLQGEAKLTSAIKKPKPQ